MGPNTKGVTRETLEGQLPSSCCPQPSSSPLHRSYPYWLLVCLPRSILDIYQQIHTQVLFYTANHILYLIDFSYQHTPAVVPLGTWRIACFLVNGCIRVHWSRWHNPSPPGRLVGCSPTLATRNNVTEMSFTHMHWAYFWETLLADCWVRGKDIAKLLSQLLCNNLHVYLHFRSILTSLYTH